VTAFLNLFRDFESPLKREGHTYKTRCPFHDDDTPSLSITPEKGLWRCFGCGEGGDAITFLQRSRGLSFGEAADVWREMSGEEPKHTRKPREGKMMGGDTEKNGTAKNGKAARASETEAAAKGEPNEGTPESGPVAGHLLERMAELYSKSLAKSEEALAYLRERGITDMETIRSFRLGYVDGSCAKLAGTKAQKEALRELGILNEKGTETLYGCIVVPLTDKDGQVTSFLGRRVKPSDNPHRALAGPKRGFFHVQAAKGAANGELVIVEGFLDALACYQAGVRNVMAIGGAANIDAALIDLLHKENVQEVLLALDPDDAGDQGSSQWAEELERRGIGSKRVRLDVDPAEFFRLGGTALGFRETVTRGEELGRPADDAEFLLQAHGVLYRVRSCGPAKSGKLRVHLVGLADGELGLVHRDTLDLYSHKARKIFANRLCERLRNAGRETTVDELESDLDTIIDGLEKRANQQAKSKGERDSVTLSPQERQEAERFLSQPELVSRLLDDMETLGYIGEEEAKLLVYLIATSRKLPRPLAGIIGSGAGAGKSFLAELAELLTPPEDVELFSKLSPQALYYLPEDYLCRKLLILEERQGGEGSDYAIRTLQSKDKLTQAVVIKDPITGKMATKHYEVTGPIAYLETTTESYLNPENTSRCFEIPLDESAEQTKRIHEHQRRARSHQGLGRVVGREELRRKHHNAQRLLESVRVVIPYAEELTFPDRYLRTRRDHERFLSLIEAVAFLHQRQRVLRTANYNGREVKFIEATPEDYAVAYRLALKVLWVSLDELSRWGRELVDWMRVEMEEQVSQGVVEGSICWTRRQAREVLGWPDRRVRDALQELVEMEHCEQHKGTPGNVFYYRLSPQTQMSRSRLLGLLTPEELKKKLIVIDEKLKPRPQKANGKA
jgi:DNA primase